MAWALTAERFINLSAVLVVADSCIYVPVCPGELSIAELELTCILQEDVRVRAAWVIVPPILLVGRPRYRTSVAFSKFEL